MDRAFMDQALALARQAGELVVNRGATFSLLFRLGRINRRRIGLARNVFEIPLDDCQGVGRFEISD